MINWPDYMQASRQRRVIIAEMAPQYKKYDALVTAGPGPAKRLDAWRTINFWQRNSVTTPFNVTGGPALVQCIGFTDDGLPLSMQIAGRPFADATVMRVAKAYEDAIPWHRRRPTLNPAAAPLAAPSVPEPAQAGIIQAGRDEIAALCERRGLILPAKHFEQLRATAPYVEEMVGHLGRSWQFSDEPSSVFRFG